MTTPLTPAQAAYLNRLTSANEDMTAKATTLGIEADAIKTALSRNIRPTTGFASTSRQLMEAVVKVDTLLDLASVILSDINEVDAQYLISVALSDNPQYFTPGRDTE